MNQIIKHQMQPCPVSCVATSIAMICGKPAQEVIDCYHAKYREHGMTLRQILEDLGVEYTAFYSVDNPSLCDEGVYLCTAPSINIEAGTHQILIEITDDNYFVIDPVMGREGRKYFVRRGDKGSQDLSVELGGFIVDAFISRAWLESR